MIVSQLPTIVSRKNASVSPLHSTGCRTEPTSPLLARLASLTLEQQLNDTILLSTTTILESMLNCH